MTRWVSGLIMMAIVSVGEGATLNTAAPAFVLLDSHHRKRSLADYKGKIVLINFWASWCAPCQEELPWLKKLAAAYAQENVQILAINVDTDENAARTMLTRLGMESFDLKVLWDCDSHVVGRYNIESMPSSFIVDPRGVIRYIHTGFHSRDPDVWRREIDELRKTSHAIN